MKKGTALLAVVFPLCFCGKSSAVQHLLSLDGVIVSNTFTQEMDDAMGYSMQGFAATDLLTLNLLFSGAPASSFITGPDFSIGSSDPNAGGNFLDRNGGLWSEYESPVTYGLGRTGTQLDGYILTGPNLFEFLFNLDVQTGLGSFFISGRGSLDGGDFGNIQADVVSYSYLGPEGEQDSGGPTSPGGAVPDAGATASLLGAGLLGLAAIRRWYGRS